MADVYLLNRIYLKRSHGTSYRQRPHLKHLEMYRLRSKRVWKVTRSLREIVTNRLDGSTEQPKGTLCWKQRVHFEVTEDLLGYLT